jgi:hypothetical protein
MPLALYRRHRRDCKGGHPENLRTSEYDERKKGWRRCECPIFASGTLQGTFKRQNTGKWEWDDAKPVAMSYDAAGNWTGAKPEPVPQPAPAEPASSRRVPIERAIKTYLAEFSEHAAFATQKKYGFVAKF